MESFRSYVDYLAMGRIQTPYLIGGMDGAFSVDVARGEIDGLEQDEIPWLLAVPKARPEAGIVPPFPVAIYLHGTGGDRLQAMGFAGHLAKFGIATVGLDLPLHGLVLPEEYKQIVDAAFSSAGFGRVGRSLQDNRTIDINYDGEPDPAGNFWGYDAFRSRDCVRQAALDVMRLVQVFSTFDGEHRWSQDADGDGRPELEGLAGDFDGDGRVDIVGPGGRFFVFGISLGGIVSSVVAPVEPKIVAAAPVSSGGGLTDVVVRTVQTGVPELAVLPFMGPLVIGATDPDTGRPVVAQYVPDGRFETLVPVAKIGEGILQAATVRLTNLENGQVDERPLPESLKFRLAVPADRGDRLVVEAFDETGRRVWLADRFDRDVEFQNMSFSAGEPLVALHQGFGVRRQSPEFRRFIQMAQTALDAGDPVNYAPLFFLRRPLARPDAHEPTALALILTAGDMNVPISTGVAQARAAGLVGFRPGEEDDRYGTTAEQVLEDNWVLEGLERLRRFAAPPWNDQRAIILDPDNLSEGTDGFDAPRLEPPLRLKVEAPAGAVSVVRFFYPSPRGAHGFGPSNPSEPFDLGRYAINAIGRFLATAGTDWSDALCLADDSCDFIPR
ncbi:MAG: hypothetical protein D6806_09270 [Deltaproteobacteria bacterium]|nr:MAG: hypothetical protein D6806_09270 [Deltaproteobacteria bacterium]